MTLHLKSISVREWDHAHSIHFPFNLPILRSLKEIKLQSPVTFLVGENGSGKSTFLEALACAVGATTVGTESVKTDKTLEDARRLAKHLRLSWGKRTHRGFFLRAVCSSEKHFHQGNRIVPVAYRPRGDGGGGGGRGGGREPRHDEG